MTTTTTTARRRWTWIAAALLLAPGCGASDMNDGGFPGGARAKAPVVSQAYDVNAARAAGEAAAGSDGPAGVRFDAKEVATSEASKAPTPASQRKIIYNANVDLTVEDFARAERALLRLVREHDGYVANSNLQGSPGSQRSGTWEVRVPAERLDRFVEEVVGLGELQARRLSSQDVSREFFDTEARIKNKKAEEQRLVKLLEEAVGKLEEILKVEEQLTRVREEIELMQGRLNQWASLVALSTVTVSIRERQPFAPPAPAAPTFGTRVARRFQASLNGLLEFGEGIVLLAVGVAPWLPLILLGALALLAMVRRALPRARPRQAS